MKGRARGETELAVESGTDGGEAQQRGDPGIRNPQHCALPSDFQPALGRQHPEPRVEGRCLLSSRGA